MSCESHTGQKSPKTGPEVLQSAHTEENSNYAFSCVGTCPLCKNVVKASLNLMLIFNALCLIYYFYLFFISEYLKVGVVGTVQYTLFLLRII